MSEVGCSDCIGFFSSDNRRFILHCHSNKMEDMKFPKAMLAKMNTNMKTNQEHMQEMTAKMETNQEKADAIHKEMMAKINNNQKEWRLTEKPTEKN
jgi:leucyl aminopeptidase (aminopeptidase T)